MSTRPQRPAALLLALAALLAAPAAPGAPPRQATPDETPPAGGFSEVISVRWVLVPALVSSPRGFVTDLEQSDFHLAVDGEPVPVASFEAGRDAPLSLVYLQDLSGSMSNGGKLEDSRRTLTYLLAKANPGDELAVASFAGDRLRVEVPFTGDREVVREAMALWQPYGTTALHDAVAWIPEISDEGRHPKRAVVLVTDGVDNASTLDPAAARSMVQRARLPVYVIGLGGGDPAESAAAGGVASDSYARLLSRLAQVTGGRYFAADSPAEIAAAARSVIGELRQQYVLGFPTGPGEERFRRIRVELVRPRKRQVTHRLGYTGGPPAPGG